MGRRQHLFSVRKYRQARNMGTEEENDSLQNKFTTLTNTKRPCGGTTEKLRIWTGMKTAQLRSSVGKKACERIVN